MSSEQIDNELDALLSVYPESINIIPSNISTTIHYKYRDIVTIKFSLSGSYPHSSSPTFSLKLHGSIYQNEKDRFNEEMQRIIDENIGNEVLFQLIQKVNDLVDDCVYQVFPELEPRVPLHKNTDEDGGEGEELVDNETDEVEAINKKPYIRYIPPSVLSSSEMFPATNSLNIIHSEITKEKKSSFQSHLCFVQSMEDVHLFRQTVLNDKRIASATHNIFVYRFTKVEESHNNNNNQNSNNSSSNSNNVISYHDFDDDGETAAGSRLAQMIRLMKVDGVALIVSRWFGGIKLGPDRFKFISNSAWTLLETNGFVK